MAPTGKNGKKKHGCVGYCSTCGKVVEVERVMIMRSKTRMWWWCVPEHHLAVAPSTVKPIE